MGISEENPLQTIPTPEQVQKLSLYTGILNRLLTDPEAFKALRRNPIIVYHDERPIGFMHLSIDGTFVDVSTADTHNASSYEWGITFLRRGADEVPPDSLSISVADGNKISILDQEARERKKSLQSNLTPLQDAYHTILRLYAGENALLKMAEEPMPAVFDQEGIEIGTLMVIRNSDATYQLGIKNKYGDEELIIFNTYLTRGTNNLQKARLITELFIYSQTAASYVKKLEEHTGTSGSTGAPLTESKDSTESFTPAEMLIYLCEIFKSETPHTIQSGIAGSRTKSIGITFHQAHGYATLNFTSNSMGLLKKLFAKNTLEFGGKVLLRKGGDRAAWNWKTYRTLIPSNIAQTVIADLGRRVRMLQGGTKRYHIADGWLKSLEDHPTDEFKIDMAISVRTGLSGTQVNTSTSELEVVDISKLLFYTFEATLLIK